MPSNSSWIPRAVLGPLSRVFGYGGVIAYHDVTQAPFAPAMHVTVDTLTRQLEFLASERYHVIPLRELISRRRTGRSLRRCVALTFDDAYHGVLAFGCPVLERFQVPATVFVATRYANEKGGGRYWWDRIGWVVSRSTRDAGAELRRAGLDLWDMSSEEMRAEIIALGAGRLTGPVETALARLEEIVGRVPERSLAEPELHELARSELIDFGCHTESHPALPLLSEDEQRREIRHSYTWLADRLPRVHEFLAYPYGLYDTRTAQAARDAGMEAAFSIEGRAAGSRFDLFTCPRIGMAEVNGRNSLALRLNWLLIPLLAWRNGGWHPRTPRPRTPVSSHAHPVPS
jgi:peptidoglycan/xylan/chitin deacetylase (PgdA/CDA1 family)